MRMCLYVCLWSLTVVCCRFFCVLFTAVYRAAHLKFQAKDAPAVAAAIAFRNKSQFNWRPDCHSTGFSIHLRYFLIRVFLLLLFTPHLLLLHLPSQLAAVAEASPLFSLFFSCTKSHMDFLHFPICRYCCCSKCVSFWTWIFPSLFCFTDTQTKIKFSIQQIFSKIQNIFFLFKMKAFEPIRWNCISKRTFKSVAIFVAVYWFK